MRVWIGIDNGVSGSVGWVYDDGTFGYRPTPVFKVYDYVKSGRQINRIDTGILNNLLLDLTDEGEAQTRIFLERPMVNPKRFQASASALRALEASLIVIEEIGLPFEYIDSKAWQKKMLPDVKGAAQLKKASSEVGLRLFPSLQEQIRKQKDADGILIAEWARRYM